MMHLLDTVEPSTWNEAKLLIPEDLMDGLEDNDDLISEAICLHLGYAYAPIETADVDLHWYGKHKAICQASRVLPLYSSGLSVCLVSDRPWSGPLSRRLRRETRMDVALQGAPGSAISSVLAILFGYKTPIDEKPAIEEPQNWLWSVGMRRQDAVKDMVMTAREMRASDIILDPMRNRMRVRFRIDGVFEDMSPLPASQGKELIYSIKELSYADPADVKKFKSKSIRYVHPLDKEEFLKVRVEIQPEVYGEGAGLRLLDPVGMRHMLGHLPFSAEDKPVIRNAISDLKKMMLVTGPTGSGKTTTLYSILSTLDSQRLNIRTLESPVEYEFDSIAQVEVTGVDDLLASEAAPPRTFAKGIRSMMRMNPNVILIGEIRDRETAAAAIEASLTGHFIMSSLHAINTIDTISRLTDLGVSPEMLATNMEVIVAQRLLATLCTCKIEQAITTEERKIFEANGVNAPDVVYLPNGCSKCGNRGFRGRQSVHEILQMNDDIADAIIQETGKKQIRRTWVETGGVTLLQKALRLVAAGKVSLQEAVEKT